MKASVLLLLLGLTAAGASSCDALVNRTATAASNVRNNSDETNASCVALKNNGDFEGILFDYVSASGNETESVNSAVDSAFVKLMRKGEGTNDIDEDGVGTSCPNGLDCREANLARHLFAALPPFAVTSQNVTNQKCLKDSRIFLRELNRFSTWALRMFDSSAKLPSGLLSSNVIQYGDFDQCLGVDSGPGHKIRGKYCLASLQVKVAEDLGRLQALHKLAHAHYMFTSTFEDPGHRVPRFSSIQWGVCVPESCDASDVHVEIERIVQSQLGADSGLQVRVKVDPAMCVVHQGWDAVPTSSLAVAAIFLTILAVAIVSSIQGSEKNKETPSKAVQLFRAFSLRKNVASLLDITVAEDEVASAHGVRLLNAYMLIVCHKSMALLFNPYVNRTGMAEVIAQPWTVIGRGAALYTDPFVMLSGLLTAHSFFRQLDRKGRLDIPKEYASRLFRLVPNLAAIILFCTFILPWLGSGPQWNQVITEHSIICKKSWWRNLLFIHNYFGFENMCLTHTHHLGIDTQLFVVSPLLVYLVWRWPKVGGAILVAIATFSTYLRYHVTFAKQLGMFVFFGTSVSQMFRTADLSYIVPSHRLTVYIMGIFLGFLLRHCGREYALKKLHVALGWTLAAVFFYLSVLEPARMGAIDYVYNPEDAANYSAFAPILFSFVFAWIIFVSHTGNAGIFGRLLKWPWFKITTRISYAVYLTQFPIFFYNVGRTRSAEQYNIVMLINIPETMFIVIASVILILLFELPFQNIRSILLKKR